MLINESLQVGNCGTHKRLFLTTQFKFANAYE